MEKEKAEELFAQGCGFLSEKRKKYDDTKLYNTIKRNDFMARDCFNQAAEMGYAPAMRELARCYIEGYGIVIKNKKIKGIKYLSQAVLAGDNNALDYCIENEYYLSQFAEGEARQDLLAIHKYYEAKERGEIPAASFKNSEKEQQKSGCDSDKQETISSVIEEGCADIKKEWNDGVANLKQIWKKGIDDIKKASKTS